VWKDTHVDEERFIAIFAEAPRWGVDPDGVRALDGVALLDLDTGEWLTEVPARVQVSNVRVPAAVAGERLAWFHLATGIVTVAGIHADWHAGVVVARSRVVASTRERTLPRFIGDLVAVGFSPNFNAPVVMTGPDVRFLRGVEVDKARFDLAVHVTLI
jgi:hypothetical protein